MSDVKERLAARLAEVSERIARAAEAAGRDPDSVTLVAVTKATTVEVARALVEAGVANLGENRVAEGARKKAKLADRKDVRWHMIGHLQRRKVPQALETFDCIHSVDSLRLAREIAKRTEGAGSGGRAPVLLEVNVSGEESKYGFRPDELRESIGELASLEPVEIRGLMTMAPIVEDAESARPVFRALADLARELDALELPGASFAELSMGMTQDYEVAVGEGATMVRIGSALVAGLGDEPPAR